MCRHQPLLNAYWQPPGGNVERFEKDPTQGATELPLLGVLIRIDVGVIFNKSREFWEEHEFCEVLSKSLGDQLAQMGKAVITNIPTLLGTSSSMHNLSGMS